MSRLRSGIVGFAQAKPTTSLEESALTISSCPFFSVGRLFVFELSLYLFSRLCLPLCSSFLSEMDVLFVDGLLSHVDPFTNFSLYLEAATKFTMNWGKWSHS